MVHLALRSLPRLISSFAMAETFLSKIMVQRHEDVETAKREQSLDALKARVADAPECMSFVQRLRAEQVAIQRILEVCTVAFGRRHMPMVCSRECSGRL